MGQRGRDLIPDEKFRINQRQSIIVQRRSNHDAFFEGDFGETYQQVGYFEQFYGQNWLKRTTMGVDIFDWKGAEHTVYLEDEMSPTVQRELVVTFFLDDQQTEVHCFETHEFNLTVPANLRSAAIAIRLKGTGQYSFHKINLRHSRAEFGTYLPGDRREVVPETGEEVLSYFIPGKTSGRLIVSFTGCLNHLPRFEMIQRMMQHEYPSLMFADVRVDGGAFGIGRRLNNAYPKAVMQRITEQLMALGLEGKDLIMNGYSTGTYPALYYGSLLKAGDIFLSKPIMSLGHITADEPLMWSGVDWLQDTRHYLTGRVVPEDTPLLDQYMWHIFDQTDHRDQTIHVMSLNQDEYDGYSTNLLLDKVQQSDTTLDHISHDGHHTERFMEMYHFIDSRIEATKLNKL